MGATGGMGEQLSLQLAKQNATLFLAGRNKEKLKKLRKKIAKINNRALIFEIDLTSKNSITESVHTAFSISKKINYLVLASGIFTPYNFADIEPYEKKKTYLTNVYGPYLLCEEFIRRWKKESYFKSIIFISSIAGAGALPNQRQVYAFSKKMIIELCKKYFALYGDAIHCNCFCPGPTETNMWKEVCASLSLHAKISVEEVVALYKNQGHEISSVTQTVDSLFHLINATDNGVLYFPSLHKKEQLIPRKDFTKRNFKKIDRFLHSMRGIS